jgi:leader peptidase (prepilin peptidase) / N-methyltransferase
MYDEFIHAKPPVFTVSLFELGINGCCYNTPMSTILPLVIVFLTGWIAGGVVNYLADVLPLRRQTEEQICSTCRSPLSLVHYAAWKTRCPECSRTQTWRVWVVQGLFILVAFWLWRAPSPELPMLVVLILMVYFGLVTVIDIEHHLILHPISLVGAILGLSIGIALHGLRSTLLGGLVGFGVMLVLYGFGILFSYINARRRGESQFEDALGFGDVNLGGVVGLLLGYPGVIAGVLLTILLAGGFSLIYLLVMLARRKYNASLAIPYGPFMVASAVWLLFLRDTWAMFVK